MIQVTTRSGQDSKAPTGDMTMGLRNVWLGERKSGLWLRHGDEPNPLADLGPANLQRELISQERSLLNAGAHADLTVTHGGTTSRLACCMGHVFARA